MGQSKPFTFNKVFSEDAKQEKAGDVQREKRIGKEIHRSRRGEEDKEGGERES